jgi:hypothetical protein
VARAVAVDSVGDVVVAGYDLENENIAMVCKYSADGQLWWSLDLPLGVPGMAYGVAVDASDHIYAVGDLTPGAQQQQAWIAKLTP